MGLLRRKLAPNANADSANAEKAGQDVSGDATVATAGSSRHAAQDAEQSNGQGKGRPTPKRREAQRRPRGPVPPPPRTRREAYRRLREQNSLRRTEARRAVRAGDDRYLPNRDRGPVRAMVRDIVDSRRNAGGMFMFVAIIVFAGYFTPNVEIRSAAVSLWMVVFLLIVVDSVVLGFRIRRLAAQRFPDRTESTRSLVWYGVSRATMVRRWRMPAPRVDVGDRI